LKNRSFYRHRTLFYYIQFLSAYWIHRIVWYVYWYYTDHKHYTTPNSIRIPRDRKRLKFGGYFRNQKYHMVINTRDMEGKKVMFNIDDCACNNNINLDAYSHFRKTFSAFNSLFLVPNKMRFRSKFANWRAVVARVSQYLLQCTEKKIEKSINISCYDVRRSMCMCSCSCRRTRYPDVIIIILYSAAL